jgi:hypothetical protein
MCVDGKIGVDKTFPDLLAIPRSDMERKDNLSTTRYYTLTLLTAENNRGTCEETSNSSACTYDAIIGTQRPVGRGNFSDPYHREFMQASIKFATPMACNSIDCSDHDRP